MRVGDYLTFLLCSASAKRMPRFWPFSDSEEPPKMRPYGVAHMHSQARTWNLYPCMSAPVWSRFRRIQHGPGWWFRMMTRNRRCQRAERKRGRRSEKAVVEAALIEADAPFYDDCEWGCACCDGYCMCLVSGSEHRHEARSRDGLPTVAWEENWSITLESRIEDGRAVHRETF